MVPFACFGVFCRSFLETLEVVCASGFSYCCWIFDFDSSLNIIELDDETSEEVREYFQKTIATQ